jgi:hypothetical protein
VARYFKIEDECAQAVRLKLLAQLHDATHGDALSHAHRGWRGYPNGTGIRRRPDGRFLIHAVLAGAPAPITLLQNWNPEAKK